MGIFDMKKNNIWIEEKHDCFKDKVKCDECKCWVDKSDAQEVNVNNEWFYYYYCSSHKKPYSKIYLPGWYGIPSGGKVRYYGEVEMDEKGKVIKSNKK